MGSATRDTSIKYLGSASVKVVGEGTLLQTVTLGTTDTYGLSAYAYTDGSAVTSADVELYVDSAAITTTFVSVGSGWYLAYGTFTGSASSQNVGAYVKAGKTVYLDLFSATLSPVNVFPYSAYPGTAALTPITAYIRTLMDDANEATARTTLGVVAGGAGDIWVEKAGDTMTGSLKTAGRARAVSTKTTTYVMTTTDEVVVCNSTTAFTITLPAASGSGRTYAIKNINTGSITVDGNSSDTIDGQTTQVLGQWDAIQIVDYAANAWVII